ncbi:zona pellucida domain-containing protein, partial [Salmonella sp. s51090]|uniref:zona pellucida domain-containing protein n=1 Tax=Salmonella sp. s51090 TaxID=3159651 RepID=UPI0039808408
TPCGKSAKSVSDGGVYKFDIPKPPEPEVECGDSYIKVRIPKTYVGNVPASDLHLHDTRCRIKEGDETYYYIEFGYDECGTIIKRSKKSKTKN